MSTPEQGLKRNETGIARSAFARELAKREGATGEGSFVLCDVSGSMKEASDTPSECRIDSLRGVVYGLKQQNAHFRTVIFESSCYEADIIPEPNGGTNMAQAFDYAAQSKAAHVIVISDGQPDSTEHALQAAQRLVDSGCKRIDVFYVGPKGAYAAGALDFMNKLAQLTGANVGSARFDELQDKIRLALTAGGAQDAEPEHKSIAL